MVSWIQNGGFVIVEEIILQVLDRQEDGFICPNQSEFSGCDTHELFQSIYALIENGVLQRRDCEGLAFEYKKQKQKRRSDSYGKQN